MKRKVVAMTEQMLRPVGEMVARFADVTLGRKGAPTHQIQLVTPDLALAAPLSEVEVQQLLGKTEKSLALAINTKALPHAVKRFFVLAGESFVRDLTHYCCGVVFIPGMHVEVKGELKSFPGFTPDMMNMDRKSSAQLMTFQTNAFYHIHQLMFLNLFSPEGEQLAPKQLYVMMALLLGGMKVSQDLATRERGEHALSEGAKLVYAHCYVWEMMGALLAADQEEGSKDDRSFHQKTQQFYAQEARVAWQRISGGGQARSHPEVIAELALLEDLLSPEARQLLS